MRRAHCVLFVNCVHCERPTKRHDVIRLDAVRPTPARDRECFAENWIKYTRPTCHSPFLFFLRLQRPPRAPIRRPSRTGERPRCPDPAALRTSPHLPPLPPQNRDNIDPESLERENDAGIAALGERVGLLRNVRSPQYTPLPLFYYITHSFLYYSLCSYVQITSGIHGEAQTQHSVLDRMAQGMGGAALGLGASAGKFKRVMEDPQGRRTVYMALGVAVVLFLLYLWAR